MMNHRFCSVLLINKRLFVARQANANGPGCIVFPMEELESPDSAELRRVLRAALTAYFDLGRGIGPAEWEDLNRKLLEATGVSSINEFERKKKEITVREDVNLGEFALFGSGKSLKNWSESAASLDDVAQVIAKKLLGRNGFFVSA
jgi:hypothetical protein